MKETVGIDQHDDRKKVSKGRKPARDRLSSLTYFLPPRQESATPFFRASHTRLTYVSPSPCCSVSQSARDRDVR